MDPNTSLQKDPVILAIKRTLKARGITIRIPAPPPSIALYLQASIEKPPDKNDIRQWLRLNLSTAGKLYWCGFKVHIADPYSMSKLEEQIKQCLGPDELGLRCTVCKYKPKWVRGLHE